MMSEEFENAIDDVDNTQGEVQEPAAPTVKSMRRNVNHIFLWLLIYNVIISVIMMAGANLLPATDTFMTYMISVVIGVAAVYLCTFKKWPVKPFTRSKKKMTGKDFVTLWGAFCITQIITIVTSIVTDAAGIDGTSIDIGEVTVFFFIYAVFIGPIAEELMYRAFSIENGSILGKIPSIILAAFAFGLMHSNLSQFIIGLLGGLVLGYVFVEYSIWWSLLIHFINNLFGVVLMMVPEETGDIVGIIMYVIFGLFAIYSIIQMIIRRDEVKAWFKAPENHGPKGTVLSVVTSPWFIVFTVFYVVMIILMMVFPFMTSVLPTA